MTHLTQGTVGKTPAHPRPFRRAVWRGLAVLCPPLLTLLIVIWVVGTTKTYFLEPVTDLAREGIVWAVADIREGLTVGKPGSGIARLNGRTYHELSNGSFIPEDVYERVQRQSSEPLPTSGPGFYRRYVDLTYLRPYLAVPFFLSLFVLLLYFLGKFMAAGIGGLFGGMFERILLRLPGVRAVYSAVKQVTDFLFNDREIKFTRIVAVEHPRKGVWSMGFVTGEGLAAIPGESSEPMLTVLVPYSPIPVTGCTIIVRKSECVDLNITFDQACQFIVSCGVVVPTERGEGRVASG